MDKSEQRIHAVLGGWDRNEYEAPQITRVETPVLIHSAFVNRRLEGTAQIDGSAILRISSPR